MINYQQGKIYKICSVQTDKIYIGSTCSETIDQRMENHIRTFNLWKNGIGRYVTSYDLLDKYQDCKIILIESYPCNNKEELHCRERYWIEINKNVLIR
jgi:hypothetical protein